MISLFIFFFFKYPYTGISIVNSKIMNDKVNVKRFVFWHACCVAFLKVLSLLLGALKYVFLALYLQAIIEPRVESCAIEWMWAVYWDPKRTRDSSLTNMILNLILDLDETTIFYLLKIITWILVALVVWIDFRWRRRIATRSINCAPRSNANPTVLFSESINFNGAAAAA